MEARRENVNIKNNQITYKLWQDFQSDRRFSSIAEYLGFYQAVWIRVLDLTRRYEMCEVSGSQKLKHIIMLQENVDRKGIDAGRAGEIGTSVDTGYRRPGIEPRREHPRQVLRLRTMRR